MSNLLNQKHTLTKLRAELEEKNKKICWCCKRFGHLVQNYKNKCEEKKGKLVLQNKFEVLVSKVM